MNPVQRLHAALRHALPAELFLHQDEALAPYECDGLSAYRQAPELVILPETVDQVRQVLAMASRLQVPVVVRGAGTGLSGGALPVAGAVLLVMSRFNRILELDVARRTARVQPGVRNLAISQAAAAHGLYYAPDPSSQIACSLGGNVAENAGGVHCLKYGLTLHNVQSLRWLDMQGRMHQAGSSLLEDAAPFDVLALLHGSEGLLGVITEIEVQLLVQPEQVRVLLLPFAEMQQAATAVTAIIASGVLPAGLELMDRLSVQAVNAYMQAGYPEDVEAVLLCELDGSAVQVQADQQRVLACVAELGCDQPVIASAPDDRQRLWAGRKAAFPATGRIAPDYYCMDGTIPRRHLGAVLQGIEELSARYGLAVANVFHAGDGNLHPLILYDANATGALQQAEAMGGEILTLCLHYGGSITGEHGVGIEKLNQMCQQFTAPELAQFHRLKAAFDPDGLLNPGKAIPTLNRCAEFGAMHVHHAATPHPDLPRF